MIEINIITVGKNKEKYCIEACDEYIKRLSRYCKLKILELPEVRLTQNPSYSEINSAIEKEGQLIIDHIGRTDVFPLCVEGLELDSGEFSSLIKDSALYGKGSLTYIIGSSYGLSEKVKSMGKRISLSKMTLTHSFAKVMLLEQIYRSFQIIQNTRYDK
jgi:23S rRNA (pseudouridine1915-N3)-methyltransferase